MEYIFGLRGVGGGGRDGFGGLEGLKSLFESDGELFLLIFLFLIDFTFLGLFDLFVFVLGTKVGKKREWKMNVFCIL